MQRVGVLALVALILVSARTEGALLHGHAGSVRAQSRTGLIARGERCPSPDSTGASPRWRYDGAVFAYDVRATQFAVPAGTKSADPSRDNNLTPLGGLGLIGCPYDAVADRSPASRFGVFLSRDSLGAQSYLSSPNGMGPWSYANLSPARFADSDGRTATDRLRILLMYERPAQERMKNSKHLSPEWHAAMADYMRAQQMYAAERDSEDLGTIGLKLTVAGGSSVVGGTAIAALRGLGALATTLWSGMGLSGVGNIGLQQAQVIDGTRSNIDPLEAVESVGWGGASAPLVLNKPAVVLFTLAGVATSASEAADEHWATAAYVGATTVLPFVRVPGARSGGTGMMSESPAAWRGQRLAGTGEVAWSLGETPQGPPEAGLSALPRIPSVVAMAAYTNPSKHPSELRTRIGKTEIVWPSSPHANETPGHWETIVARALAMAKSGRYRIIYVNKGINNELGPGVADPNNRPDVWGVRWDGKNDLVEVPSGTDEIPMLKARMRDSLNQLGTGGTGIIEPVNPRLIPKRR